MRKLCVAFLGVFLLLFISCNNDQPIGKWDDNIKLSQKKVDFDSASNSISITSVGENWWLSGISLNNVSVDISGVNNLGKKFIVTNADFQVERKDSKTIIVSINKNTTNADRTLVISLEDGDYFDGIVVTQSK